MSIFVPWAFEWEKPEKFNFSVAFILLGMEKKCTSLHINARGQGHLSCLETGYVASGSQVLQSLYKW